MVRRNINPRDARTCHVESSLGIVIRRGARGSGDHTARVGAARNRLRARRKVSIAGNAVNLANVSRVDPAWGTSMVELALDDDLLWAEARVAVLRKRRVSGRVVGKTAGRTYALGNGDLRHVRTRKLDESERGALTEAMHDLDVDDISRALEKPLELFLGHAEREVADKDRLAVLHVLADVGGLARIEKQLRGVERCDAVDTITTVAL